MKDPINKRFLDLVVNTANDLAQHHVAGSDSRTDDKLKVVAGDIDSLLTMVSDAEKRQEVCSDEIVKLDEGYSGDIIVLRELLSKSNVTASENFAKAADEIDNLATALNKFDDDLDDKASDERVVKLSNKIRELNKLVESNQLDTIGSFHTSSVYISELKSSLSAIQAEVETNDEVTLSFIERVSLNLDNIQTELNKELDAQKQATSTFVYLINEKHDELHDNTTKLKANIVGCVDDVRVISEEFHKFVALSEVIVSSQTESNVAQSDNNSQVADSIKNLSDLTVDIRIDSDKTNNNVSELSVALGEQVELREKDNDHANTALIQVHDLLKALQHNNEQLGDRVDETTIDLLEKFKELANESFLSSDKIDLKFSEMQLSIVESDIKRTEVVKESISALGDELRDELDSNFTEYGRSLVEDNKSNNEKLLSDVDQTLRNDRELVKNAKPYVSGTKYGENVVTLYHGGIWQARHETKNAPKWDTDDWLCLSNGFYKSEILETHSNGVEVTVGLYDSLGGVHELTLPIPTINYIKGVYREKFDYDHLDSIMKDGCRWVAIKDNPEGAPGDDGADWQVLTMRGPKGMKGASGERGPKGEKGIPGKQGDRGDIGETPEMQDIVKALFDFEKGEPGQNIRRARGHWKLGEMYASGDVVNVGTGLFLALNPNDGTQTPASSTEDWLLLIQSSVASINSAPSYDIIRMPAEITDVADTYPVDVDTVEVDEVQVRLELLNRPAGEYVASFSSHHNIDSVVNSVFIRYSTTGGASWMEVSRESKDITEELMVYSAIPITHVGGALDILLQIRKENIIDTLIVRHAEVWLDAKFV